MLRDLYQKVRRKATNKNDAAGRLKKDDSKSALPLYSDHNHKGFNKNYRSNHSRVHGGGTSSANMALFGGCYYGIETPTKQHRRRRVNNPHQSKIKQRSLCYRITWSSPIRRVLLIISVVILFVTQNNKLLKSYTNENRWDFISDGLIRLPAIASELNWEHNRWTASTMYEKEKDANSRQNIYNKNRHGLPRRDQLEIIKKIVPEWASRNEKQINADEITGKIRTIKNMDTSQKCSPKSLESPPSVTLILQSTSERLWILQHTCLRWGKENPIILVVYGLIDASLESQIADDWCSGIKLIKFIEKENQRRETWEYPINEMRNIGLNHLETTHFIVMDIDFVPSSNLREVISSYFNDSDHTYPGSDKDAVVIPAFERLGSCSTRKMCQLLGGGNKDQYLPSTFKQLKECVLAQKNCQVFQQNNNWEGHFTTQSEAWLEGKWYEKSHAATNNSVGGSIAKQIKCFHSTRYEPYLMLRYCPQHTPYYDERFYGYGKNKIQYISHLRYLKYRFSILPGGGYIIHHPHPESAAKEKWEINVDDESKTNIHKEMDTLYVKFMKELSVTHGKPDLPICVKQNNK